MGFCCFFVVYGFFMIFYLVQNGELSLQIAK